MTKKRGYTIGLSVGILFTALWAQHRFSILNFDLSPRQVRIGDPIEVKLDIAMPSQGNIVIPMGDQWKPAEVLKVDTLEKKGGRLSLRYQIALYELGEVKLSSIPIIYLNGEQSETLWVEGGTVQVQSLLGETSDTTLRDVKPPVPLPFGFKEMLPYIGTVLLIVILAIFFYRLWRGKRKKGEYEPIALTPSLPPHLLALKRLEELRSRRLWQNGFLKAYYSELSQIFRQYLEGRFQINAEEMTTYELLSLRDRWANDEAQFRAMRRFLLCADLVKFARFIPEENEHDRFWEEVRVFIQATAPHEEALSATIEQEGR